MAPIGFIVRSATTLLALKCYDDELIGLLHELAEQDDKEARFALGTCYLDRMGVPRDYVKALVWKGAFAVDREPDIDWDTAVLRAL